MGAQTRAVMLALAPTATATGAVFRITSTSVNAAATAAGLDFFIKTTDPPLIVACKPGDKVHAIGIAACTAYLSELTH